VEESKPKRNHKRATIEDAKRWADMYRNRISILRIASQEGVNPGTVSKWIKKVGIKVKSGQHFVSQPPLKYPQRMIDLALLGTSAVIQCVRNKVWGAQVTGGGLAQVEKFCKFVSMHQRGLGVEEIARSVHAHRSTIAQWREGTDQPYLIRIAIEASEHQCDPGWKILPIHLSSGAEEQRDWIQVPVKIRNYEDVVKVVSQLQPLLIASVTATEFGITDTQLADMREELFAYLLAMMVGDSSKSGGEQERFVSMALDLQLILKQPSNLRFGRFVCFCTNTIGLQMKRIADKQPTGTTRFGKQPSAAFRWTSERSPFLAWMFSVALGLNWNERTSYDPLRMDWIHSAPRAFRLRFVQGLADSDASVKDHEVIITSVPNAEFLASLLRGLGAEGAHPIKEKGQILRTYINWREAASLPLFSEFVGGYRYQKLLAIKERHSGRNQT
jgi:transposase-like protein